MSCERGAALPRSCYRHFAPRVRWVWGWICVVSPVIKFGSCEGDRKQSSDGLWTATIIHMHTHPNLYLLAFVFVLAATNTWVNAWAPPEVSSSFSRRPAAQRNGHSATWRYRHSSFKGSAPVVEKKSYGELTSLLWSDSKEKDAARPDEEPDKGATNAPKKKYTSARMGGRKRKLPRRDSLSAKNDKDDNIKRVTKWATVLAPILLLWVLLKSLLFGGTSEPSYVYYQSSVYESRTYGADGRVDTSRKESFRSNIPSLIEGKRLQQEPRGSSSSYLLRQDPDESFEQELDSMLQLQESILKDFFR